MREVVAPTAPAGKLTDRHQLDGRHSQTAEILEAGGQGVERAFRSKRAHVQFVEHEFGAGQTLPRSFGPVELIETDHGRRTMQSVRLPAGRRIGPQGTAIEGEGVPPPLRHVRFGMDEVAAGSGFHDQTAKFRFAAGAVGQEQFDLFRARRPDAPAD